MHALAEPYGLWEILKLRLEHVGRLGPMNCAKYDLAHSAYVPFTKKIRPGALCMAGTTLIHREIFFVSRRQL